MTPSPVKTNQSVFGILLILEKDPILNAHIERHNSTWLAHRMDMINSYQNKITGTASVLCVP